MGLYSQFVKHITYPLINYREGIRGIHFHLREFEKTQYLPLQKLKEIQWQKLEKLLNHAYENAIFYREILDSIGLKPGNIKSYEEFLKIPILTKEVLRASLPKMIARNFRKDELHSSETGGTTGVKIQFYRNNSCLAPKAAATIRHERWTGWDLGERVGLVWPAKQDYIGAYTLKSKLKNVLSERYITLPAAVLTHEDIYRYCIQLKRFQPTKIRCFPYPLYLVAEFIEKNSVKGIHPKGIISTGEPLYEHQRESLEDSFNCRVFDSYSSRETGLIAQECEYHNGLHINMECVFVEFIGEDGTPVGDGEIGRIIVTDLLNYGMPMIRYDIGDLGIPSSERCPCKRSLPFMYDIQGRVVDKIILPNREQISSVTLVLYLVDNGPPVGQVQIVQDAIDHLTIKMTRDPEPDESVFRYYRDTARELLGEEMKISFDIVDSIPREPSGKYRFVKSLL